MGGSVEDLKVDSHRFGEVWGCLLGVLLRAHVRWKKGNLSEEWGGGVVCLTCVNDEIMDVSRTTAG